MTPFVRQTLDDVAKLRGITVKMLVGSRRLQHLVHARADVAKRLYAHGYTAPQIGAILNRDHSTILYAIGRGKKRLRPEPEKVPNGVQLLPYAGALREGSST